MKDAVKSMPEQQPSRRSALRTILEGLGFYLLGFVGFLVSVKFAGKIKVIVGVASLFGGGLIGLGTLRLLLRDRFPTVTKVVAAACAVVGLLLTLAAVDTLLGIESSIF